MVLLEQFYYLNEEKHEVISSLWRFVPMIFIIIGSISGLFYSVVFGSIPLRFAGRCIFYSTFYEKQNVVNNTNVTYLQPSQNSTGSAEEEPRLKFTYEIQWTPIETCDIMQFTPFFCSIFGIVLLTLLFMCGKGGNDVKNGLHKPWRIVVPVIITTLLFSILCIVILRYYTKGLNIFCDDYQKTFGAKGSCSHEINVVSRTITSDRQKVKKTIMKYMQIDTEHYDYYTIDSLLYYMKTSDLIYLAKIMLIIALSSWSACLLLFVVRIVAVIDFRLIEFTVRSCEIVDTNFINQYKDLSEEIEKMTGSMEGIVEEEEYNLPRIRSAVPFHSLFETNEDTEPPLKILPSKYQSADKTQIFEPKILRNITLENTNEIAQKSKRIPKPESEPSYPDLDEDKNRVQFKQPNLETIYQTKINEMDDEAETETEMVTYSPTHSTVTLASPEPSDDSVELIALNNVESPEKKKKVKKVTIV